MQIFHLNTADLKQTTSKHLLPLPPLVMTIGNFDGVHLGHQAMLQAVCRRADLLGYQRAVMIFEPQPKEFFASHQAPARLMSLTEKCTRLADFGIDFVLVAHFDANFAWLSADEFCEILARLNVRHLVLGDDFRFGQGRQGNQALLLAYGFGVDGLDSVLVAGQRVSSTDIRHQLSLGQLEAAKRLLGTDYCMMGQVVHGDKIGRSLGFATANIAINRHRPALQGVFAVDVSSDDPQFLTKGGLVGLQAGSLFGCANIGVRPSVDGVVHDWRLEVHLPDFEGDLYGQTLTVRFLYYLHGEKKYPSLEALKAGIADDVACLLAWRDGAIKQVATS